MSKRSRDSNARHTKPDVTAASPTFFETAAAFRLWLEAHAASERELLVGFRKVGSGLPSMSWSESVDEALCFGWIDGVRKRVDETSYTIRFSPRPPTSIWSAINIAKFAKLQAQGRITPAGAKAYAHRKEDKSAIYAYEQAAAAEFSLVEQREFKRQKAAWRFFESTPPSYLKLMRFWVHSAKKPETRAGRFAKLLAACAAGKRL